MKHDVEKVSKLINLIILIVAIIVALIIIVVIATIFYEVSSDKDNLLCYSIKCFNNFISFFEIIPKIFAFFVAIMTVLLGWLTVQIYLSTYLTTYKSNNNTQNVNAYSTYFEHLKYFNNIVDHYLDQNEIIKGKNIDKFKFYDFLFVDPRLGDFEISNQYKDIVKKIDIEIERLNLNLPRKIGYVEHRDLTISLFETMGVKLPICERKDFFKLEQEIFKFISNVNKNNGLQPLKDAKYNPY